MIFKNEFKNSASVKNMMPVWVPGDFFEVSRKETALRRESAFFFLLSSALKKLTAEIKDY